MRKEITSPTLDNQREERLMFTHVYTITHMLLYAFLRPTCMIKELI